MLRRYMLCVHCIDTVKAKLHNNVFIEDCGAFSMHGPAVLVYIGSVHQSLYNYTVEPGASLASVEVLRVNNK
jgi:hypothetical protein